MNPSVRPTIRRAAGVAAILAATLFAGSSAFAQTVLSDAPVAAPSPVPGNLLLVLSVEYPTASSIANSANYSANSTYVGYFNPAECYVYEFDPTTLTVANGTTAYASNTDLPTQVGATVKYVGNYFYPAAAASATHTCTGMWSGNFMNWATMQTIDPFRWALTGGYRVIDYAGASTPTAPATLLEKAWASGQGGSGETPNRSGIPVAPSSVTPFNWGNMNLRLWGLGNRLEFSGGAAFNGNNQDTADTPWTGTSMAVNTTTIYSVKVRVAACTLVATETNCTAYGAAFKPEGLIQQYNQKIRVGAMGYLNDSNILRDAGVLRAPIDFVGPVYPVFGVGAAVGQTATNPYAEWSATTGVYNLNPYPDTAYSASTPTTNSFSCQNSAGVTLPACQTLSGTINYLNEFGESAQTYKTYDPVSELYYAAQRYFRGLGNVPQWTNLSTSPSGSTYNAQNHYTLIDGFPVFQAWPDPIQYACQKNFILGIGDVNTHASGNVAGAPNAIFPTSGPGSPSATNFNTGGFQPTQLPQHSGGNEPTIPPLVLSDTSVDSVGATNFIGQFEGLGNLGQVNIPWCCGDDPSYFMAGLAYDAHVRDMRPGQFTNAQNINAQNGQKVSIQTLTTYWFDVQEYQAYHYQNQFWLAAKYGGFPVQSGYTPYTLPAAANKNPHTGWLPSYQPSTTAADDPADLGFWATQQNLTATQGSSLGITSYGDSLQPGGSGVAMPNNYFGAGNAQAMVTGLNSAFASIAAQSSATPSAFSSTTPNLSAIGSGTYSTNYSTANWTGNVTAQFTTFSPTGAPSSSNVWAVTGTTGTNPLPDLIDPFLGPYTCGTSTCYGWNLKRVMITRNGTGAAAGNGIPFRLASMPASYAAAFTVVPGVTTANQSAQNYVNYLRGDQSNEAPAATGYRARTQLLGDIVDSAAAAIGPPNGPYSDQLDPGYSSFKSTWASRPTMIYVGANDGMMHAFNGTVPGSPPGGTEVFAYVPSFVINGPTATPAVNGLASLGAVNFTHHMFVDSTPQVFDVDFTRSGTGTGSGAANWHSILIGGLGKGGMGFYALDVTNPAAFSTETNAASEVMWEFGTGSAATMGYSYGLPLVVQTAKWGWVVVLTSGYNNADGHGYFYFVNPVNGALLETVTTSSLDGGTPTNPSGLAQTNAFVTFASGMADSIYAGDLLGNVWRVGLTNSSGPYQANLVQLAHLVSPSGGPQPITAAVGLGTDSLSHRYVLVGTGQLLGQPDYLSSQIQSFYAIVDGTAATFGTAATLPSGITYPITRANLVNNTTQLATGVTTAQAAAQPEGWYVDFPTAVVTTQSPTNPNTTVNYTVAYRENVSPAVDDGEALFGGNLPEGDVCNPQGTNLTYAASLNNGKSTLVDTSGNVLTSIVVPGGMLTSLQFVAINSGTSNTCGSNCATGIACTSNGTCIELPTQPPGNTGIKRLNWREVPTAD